jgi:hypothetical protein
VRKVMVFQQSSAGTHQPSAAYDKVS